MGQTQLYSAADAARIVGLPVRTLWSAIYYGTIAEPSHPKGRRMYFNADDVEAIRAHYEGRRQLNPQPPTGWPQ